MRSAKGGFVFGRSQLAYFLSSKALLSKLAHACATSLSGSAPPGKVAHPALIRWLFRSQERSASRSTIKPLSRLAACSNLSTQIGAKALTVAAWLAVSTLSSTVLPSCHPPQPKPMTAVPITPTAKPWNRRFGESPPKYGDKNEGISMGFLFAFRGRRIPPYL